MEQYLTSEQVAKLLQVHPFTVLKYLKSGKIKGVKIGRVYRIKESDVESFLRGANIIIDTEENNPKKTEEKIPQEKRTVPPQEEEATDYYEVI